MTSQATAEAAQYMTMLRGEPETNSLYLLDGIQSLRAELFGVVLIERVTKSTHGIVKFKDWFYELDTAQRTQVTDYYDTLLLKHSIKLEWFGRGHHYGYRFADL